MNEKQRLQSPEEVSKLMEAMWIGHKTGAKLPENNVYFVDLPPLTEEEREELKALKEEELKAKKEHDDQPEDLFGSWI